MRTLLALLPLLALPALAQDGPATVRGRLVDPAGTPLVGATLVLRCLPPPPSWTDLERRTDAQGRFTLRFMPPDQAHVTLEARAAGLAPFVQSWRALAPGEDVDLGEVTLLPAGVVTGRIVDAAGEAISGPWKVIASIPGGRALQAELDLETGEFRFDEVPATRVDVQAYSRRLRTETTSVQVEAGGEQFVELRYEGPDPGRRISLRILAGTNPFGFQPESVRLIDAGGKRHEAVQDDFFVDYTFDDLEPGAYEVVVDDPRFERWSRAGVRPGEALEVNLVGSAALSLEVVDAESGEALPRFGLTVSYRSAPRELELLAPNSAAPADGVVRGLVPEPCELVLTAPSRPAVRVELLDSKPGETTPLRIEVPLALQFFGLVVDAEGRPDVQGVSVEWTPGPEHGHTGGGTLMTNGQLVPNAEAVLKLDARGRFELAQAGPGQHALRVRWNRWLTRDLVIELPGDAVEPLVVERPAHGWLTGKLHLPPGIDASQVQLDLRQRSIVRMPLMASSVSAGGIEIQGDRYRMGPLPPGRHEVVGGPASRRIRSFRGGEALAEVTVRAGETTEHDLDLRSVFPGSLTVRAHAQGELVTDAWVTLLSGDRDGAQLGARDLDQRGQTEVSDLTGGRYTVSVQSGTEGWSYDHPTVVVVPAGGRAAIEVEVPLVTRMVRFVDPEDGAPLARAQVTWASGRGRASGRTDAAGHLVLTLVAGPVSFGRGERLTTEEDWSAGEDALVLAPPEGD